MSNSTMGSPHSGAIRYDFEAQCMRLPIDSLVALKTFRPEVRRTKKYQQILASIRSLKRLVEPIAVTPSASKPGSYLINDGVVRVECLKDLGIAEVDCLVSEQADTYSYNARVNRLAPAQDHKMILRAIKRGVPAERIAETLGLKPSTIRQHFRLLDGICPEAVERLAHLQVPAGSFGHLKRMTPLRQIEAAELMVSQNNFSMKFAAAILGATQPDELVESNVKRVAKASTPAAMARLERELIHLQGQARSMQDTYGPDLLALTVIAGYVDALLAKPGVANWLARNRPDYLKEFVKITDRTGRESDAPLANPSAPRRKGVRPSTRNATPQSPPA